MNAYKDEHRNGVAVSWRPDSGPAPAQSPASTPSRRATLGRSLHTSRRARLSAALALIGVCGLAVPVLVTVLTPKPAKALVAAHELTPGTVITKADLSVASASGPAGGVVPAGQESSIVGQQIRYLVPAGAMLSPADLGSFPPIGSSVVPVAVKPGQYPADLQVGQPVAVFPISSGATAAQAQEAAHAAASGYVTQIAQAPSDGSGEVMVDIEVANTSAPVVAQAPAVVLVALDARGDAP